LQTSALDRHIAALDRHFTAQLCPDKQHSHAAIDSMIDNMLNATNSPNTPDIQPQYQPDHPYHSEKAQTEVESSQQDHKYHESKIIFKAYLSCLNSEIMINAMSII
jgi:hypothetical protein